MTTKMPVLFVGHGNPMNVIRPNPWTSHWEQMSAAIPRPRAILVVSAHWYIAGCKVTAMSQPRTIHDFGNFPPALFAIQYPAPGDPELAARIVQLLAPLAVTPDQEWGLDHGAWQVLCSLYPQADIPVVQLSIDRTAPPAFHYALGQKLAPLRDEGVLLLGSGNLVHNLRAYNWDNPEMGAFDWAARFEAQAQKLMASGQDEPLIEYTSLGDDARLSIPTPDHYLPLLYVLGARQPGDQVSFPCEGFDGGSMSMLAVQLSQGA